MFLYYTGSQPTPSTQQGITQQGMIQATDRRAFAIDVLRGVGNTAPTEDMIQFIIEWTIAEDGSNGALNRNNPLNTTQMGFNETTTINDDGVKGYRTYQDGLSATLQTLSYTYYTEIVAGMQTNDVQRAKQGLFNSPWASSHYGYGASWPK